MTESQNEYNLKFSIIKPQAMINEVENPCPQTLAHYAAYGGATISNDSAHSRNVGYCLKVAMATLAGKGVFYTKPISTLLGKHYEFSCDVWGAKGSKVEVEIINNADAVISSEEYALNGQWRRIRHGFTGAGDLRFRVVTATPNTEFWLDRLQIVEGVGPFSFFTGAGMPRNTGRGTFYWEGKAWDSRSICTGLSRTAGVEVDLEELFSVSSAPGLGLGSWEQRMTDVLTGGSLYQDYRYTAKAFSLAGQFQGDTHEELWEKRKLMADLVRPDSKDGTLISLLFQLFDKNTELPLSEPVRIECACTSGLMDIPTNGVTKDDTINFVIPDGMIYGDYNNSFKVGEPTELQSNCIVMRDRDGNWVALPGLSGYVRCVAVAPNGWIFAGGDFTNYLRYWDGTGTWKVVSASLNGVVRAIAITPSGKIFIGGEFTNENRIAWFTTDDLTLHPVTVPAATAGVNNTVRALLIDDYGNLYVGGTFTTAGGLASNRIAYWNDKLTRWETCGTQITSGAVNALERMPDGRVFVAGGFGTADVSLNRALAYRHPDIYGQLVTSRNLVNNSGIDRLARESDGSILLSGSFEIPGTHSIGLARYRNNAYTEVSPYFAAGPVHTPLADVASFAGEIIAVANTKRVTGKNGKVLFDYIGIYKNGVWLDMPEIQPKTREQILGVYFTPSGELIIHGAWTSPLRILGDPNTAHIVSENTAITYPKLRLFGPASLQAIKNKNTGKTVYFQDAKLADGSVLDIDFRPDNLRVTVDGRNRMDLIKEGSDLANFYLEPGANKISLMTEDDPNVPHNEPLAWIWWQPRFWSLEGSLYDGEL